MRYALLVFVLLLLVVGCGDTDYQHPHTDVSPDSHKVYIPESVYEHGLYLPDETLTDREEIRDTLLYWVDLRVQVWKENWHPDLDQEYLSKVARETVIVLVDHWGIPCNPCALGHAHGQYHFEGFAEITIYHHLVTDNPLKANYPPHLTLTGEEAYEWLGDEKLLAVSYNVGQIVDLRPPGSTEYFSVGCYDIPHELDHAIGIHH